MKRILVSAILICAAAVAACSSRGEKLKERMRHWQGTAVREIPIGTRKTDLERWAQTRRVQLMFYTAQHEAIAVLETVPGDGLVCSHWFITLNIPVDENGTSTGAPVISKAGNCL